jgi:hypothetical protein
MMRFTNEIKEFKRVHIPKEFSIEDEPMLFSSDIGFAYLNGGPITRTVINALIKLIPTYDTTGNCYIVDTKSVLLQVGQYPCIPGWHCDSVPRNESGQPDFSLIKPHINEDFLLFTHADKPNSISNTEFVDGPIDLEYDPANVWSSIDKALEAEPPKTIQTEDDVIYLFNELSLHRGTAAREAGWRFFMRITYGPETLVQNKIRKQVQVYVPQNYGW